MCLPHPRYQSGHAWLTRLRDMALDQRESDARGKSPEGRPDVGYRGDAAMCVAYCSLDGYYYIGYSGTSGGMFKYGTKLRTDQAERRIERLENANLDPMKYIRNLDRCQGTCSEACAASIAIAWICSENDRITPEDVVKNLFFISFWSATAHEARGRGDTPKPLCESCQTWVPKASLGYWHNGRFYCRNGGPGVSDSAY